MAWTWKEKLHLQATGFEDSHQLSSWPIGKEQWPYGEDVWGVCGDEGGVGGHQVKGNIEKWYLYDIKKRVIS